jgi:hypothetical protein
MLLRRTLVIFAAVTAAVFAVTGFPAVSAAPTPGHVRVGVRVVGSTLTATEAAFPEQTIARYFWNGAPHTFEGTALTRLPAGEPVMLSFNDPPSDATFKTLLTDWDRQGRLVIWAYYHEPEAGVKFGHITLSGWKSTMSRLIHDQQSLSVPNVRSSEYLMGWTDDPQSGRNINDWLVPGIQVMGFDTYTELRWVGMNVAFGDAHHLPVVFPELGANCAGRTMSDAASATFVKQAYALMDDNVLGFAWFDGGTNALSTRPLTLAALRSLARL